MGFRRFTILGLGLIGGSLALATRKRVSGCHITAYDINSEALRDALAAGLVDQIGISPAAACEGAECIILCVPVGQVGKILSEIAPALKPGVCVTDVASVKTVVVELADRLLPAGVHFVGAHPMTGRELSGFAAARAELFEHAQCLVTPVAKTDAFSLQGVEMLWQALGSRIVRLSPQEHDRRVAQISHLPHLLASALMNCVTDEALAIAGAGFRDLTRIASGSPALWRDIVLANKAEVRAAVVLLRQQLDAVEPLLERVRGDELEAWLAHAAGRRGHVGGRPKDSD